MKWIRFLAVLFVVFTHGMHATELLPWGLPQDLELYPRFDYQFQHISSFRTRKGTDHRKTDGNFYTLGLSGSYAPWSLDVSTTFANTRDRNFGLDEIRVSGQYQYLNDIVGDPVSLAFGLSLDKASRQAVRDLSSFHHGRNEAELYVSVGKECPCMAIWTSRWWGICSIGVGDHGSPWIRGELFWEKNFYPTFVFRAFVHSLVGLGGDSLSLGKHFDGYGSLRHRSVDLGLRVCRESECNGTFCLEYSTRVFARQYPKCVDRYLFRFLYPFGL